MKIQTEIIIHADIDQVFDTFRDLDIIEKHVQGITLLERLNGPAKMEVGTKWRETRVMFGKEATEVMWVTEMNKDKNYVVEAESRGTHYRSEYTFTQQADDVLVQLTFEGIPLTFGTKIMSALFFLFAGMTKKMLLKDMKSLKVLLESEKS